VTAIAERRSSRKGGAFGGALTPLLVKAVRETLSCAGGSVRGHEPFADPSTVITTMETIWLRVIGPPRG
jgi:hypothetical protein